MIRSSSTSSSGRLGKKVDLVQDDDLRQLVEPGAVGGQLAVDRRPALGGLAVGRVDHVHEHAGALEVREELVAEANALACALDQPRHVRDRQLPPVGRVDSAEDRRERRERVFGDLRPRVRDSRQKRRLTRVRKPDESRVGQELQPQLELGLPAGQPDLGEAGRLPRRRGEAAVAPAPAPPPRATTTRAPGLARSATSWSPSKICVPAGTCSSTLLAGRAVLARAAARARRARLCPLRRAKAREVAQIGVGDERRRPRQARRRRRRGRPSGRASPAGSSSRRRHRARL